VDSQTLGIARQQSSKIECEDEDRFAEDEDDSKELT
jgi:hypothetical protein